MQADLFIALINPSMAMIFAIAFLVLWHHRDREAYIAVLAAAFAFFSLGFLLQYFSPLGIAASRLISNVMFLAGGIATAAGILGRYRISLPLLPVAVIAGTGLCAFSWFMWAEPDLTWRIYVMNFAFGGLALMLVAELRRVRERKAIDRLLYGMTFFWGVSFFPRPILVMWVDGPYTSYEGFHQSLYWITLTFSASLFLLLFALAMITAIVIDVIDELRHESHTDPLSGLHNRRGFEVELERRLAEARKRRLPVSLVVCDLDHFKCVNDRFGHAAGDMVLVAFADCLRETLQDRHLVGRIGGEEFAILVDDADLGTGRLFAEGVRAAFSCVAASGLPEDMRFTASFGVAEAMAGESTASLFSRADRALYDAKKSGRDCVRVASTKRGGHLAAPPQAVDLASGI